MVKLAHVVSTLLNHPVHLEHNREVLVGVSGVPHLEVSVEVLELHLTLGVQELVLGDKLHEDHVGLSIDLAHHSALILGESWIQGFVSGVSDYPLLPGFDPSIRSCVYPRFIVVANSTEFK